MSDEWIEIPRRPRGVSRTNPTVSVACRAISGNSAPRLAVCIGAVMADALGWQARMRVAVARNGAGDRLRIVRTEAPAGFPLVGKSKTRLLNLYPDLDWPLGVHRAEVAETEVADGALLVTLPAWARRPGGRALPAAPQPTPSPPARACPAADPEEKWTAERDDLIRALWHDASVTSPEILARVNALPGPLAAEETGSLYYRAKRLGLPGSRQQAFQAPPAPGTPPPEPVARHPELRPRTPEEEDIAEARTLFRAGRGARFVADEFGWELSRAQKLAVEVRREMEAEAASRALSPEAAA